MLKLLRTLAERRPTLLALLALTAASTLLLPLLRGAFLLDDLPNLGGLARAAADRNAWLNFITSGLAGPGGRPIALLSFALQAEHWPAHPLPFKAVNLALHL